MQADCVPAARTWLYFKCVIFRRVPPPYWHPPPPFIRLSLSLSVYLWPSGCSHLSTSPLAHSMPNLWHPKFLTHRAAPSMDHITLSIKKITSRFFSFPSLYTTAASLMAVHKALFCSGNKGCTLRHWERQHCSSCLRHARTDKRPEKQMVRAFMTSFVEAQESKTIQGRALFCPPSDNKAFQSARKLEMHLNTVL